MALLAEIRGLIDARDADKCISVLRAALGAEASARAPREKEGKNAGKNDYLIMPDWSTRLTAVKIMLAYRFGNAPTHNEVHVFNSAVPATDELKTPEETMRGLLESGADLPKIIGTYVGALTSANPEPVQSAPTPQPWSKLAQPSIAVPVEEF